MCFVKLYNIFAVKNALVRSVYCVMEYTIWNHVMKFCTWQ